MPAKPDKTNAKPPFRDDFPIEMHLFNHMVLTEFPPCFVFSEGFLAISTSWDDRPEFHLTFMGNIIIVKGDCKPTNITGRHHRAPVFNPAFLFAGPRREGRLHEGPWFAADVSQCLGHSLGSRLGLQQQWFHRNGGHWGRKLWANTLEGQVMSGVRFISLLL